MILGGRGRMRGGPGGRPIEVDMAADVENGAAAASIGDVSRIASIATIARQYASWDSSRNFCASQPMEFSLGRLVTTSIFINCIHGSGQVTGQQVTLHAGICSFCST